MAASRRPRRMPRSALSGDGYQVDLVNCGPPVVLEPEWADRYSAAGVEVVDLDRSRAVHPPPAADSYRLYEQLRDRDYTAIVFQDWQGLGYCAMTAKHLGLAFESTRLVDYCHGPGAWLREANRQLVVEGFDLALAHMEQASARLADTVVSPSRHLLDWMGTHDFEIASDQRVIPYFTAGADRADQGRWSSAHAPRLQELVFFGRLEERKGVRLFAEAVNRLGPDRVRDLRISFLGREATFTARDVEQLLDPAVRAAVDVQFHGRLDQPHAVRTSGKRDGWP